MVKILFRSFKWRNWQWPGHTAYQGMPRSMTSLINNAPHCLVPEKPAYFP